MNKNEIISLLKLLEDPDEKVFELIKTKILADAEMFKVYLDNFHALSVNELAIERSELLIEEIFLLYFKKQLKKYINSNKPNLLEGVLLLEEYFNREIDVNYLKKETTKIIQSIWIELNDQLTGIEKVKLIGKTLFEQLKFRKYPVSSFKPEYLSFFNCIAEKKYVAPNISLLYCIIAQEIELPLYPVALPGLFILSYVDPELADVVFEEKNNGAVVYINPFDKGEFINHQIVENYLEERKIKKKLQDFENMTYLNYLSFFFDIRILALKHKNLNGFELKYANQIKEIFTENLL